jgi:membrane protease YdiL (CAAX protease family)
LIVFFAVSVFLLSPFPIGWLISPLLGEWYSKTLWLRNTALAASTIGLVYSLERTGKFEAPWVLDSHALIGVSIGVSAVLLLDGLSLRYLLQRNEQSIAQYVDALPRLKGLRAHLGFLYTNASASVWEELAFRCLPYMLLEEDHLELIAGAIVSSAFFGMQHARFGWRQVAYSSIFGIAFWMLLLATETIWASVAAHFVGNAFVAIVCGPRLARSLRDHASLF